MIQQTWFLFKNQCLFFIVFKLHSRNIYWVPTTCLGLLPVSGGRTVNEIGSPWPQRRQKKTTNKQKHNYVGMAGTANCTPVSILSFSPLAIDNFHPPRIYHMVTQLKTPLLNLPLGMATWQGCERKPWVLLLDPVFKEEAGYLPPFLCPFHGLAHQQGPTEPALAIQMEATFEGGMDNKTEGIKSWMISWDRPSPASGLLHKREIKS